MTISERSPSNLLERTRFEPQAELSPIQLQVDALTTHFVEEATSASTLGAMMAGGMAYRLGRIGTLALGEGRLAAAPLRLLSLGVGLSSEVGAFELTSRTLQTVSGSRAENANLWNWSGQGGWAQGLSSSLITFGMLKSAGFLAREQNLVFQHALQSSTMVLGHNVMGSLGLGPRPEGSLAEQWLHAEATNLQLGAGTSLVSSLAPGISSLEQGLDLTLRNRSSEAPLPRIGEALVTAEGFVPGLRLPSEEGTPANPHILFSVRIKDNDGTQSGSGSAGGPSGSDRPWSPPQTQAPLHRHLRTLREDSGLTQEGVAEALKTYGFSTPREKIATYEGGDSYQHSYRFLRSLAEIYEVDPRDLIDISNRTHFSDIDPKLWRTSDGPLFLNARNDGDRLLRYQLNDPQRVGLGWLLFSWRRNPLHYHETAQKESPLAGIPRTTWDSLEDNAHPPSPETVRLLGEALGKTESEILRATNETYFPDLVPLMETLFPGENLYLHSRSQDEAKIRHYSKNPLSLGKRVFLGRKRMPGQPSARELAQNWGSDKKYLNEREWDLIGITPGNLSDWIQLFGRLKLPLEGLHPHLPEGLSPEGPAFELARAMEGRGIQRMIEETGVSRYLLDNILNSRRPRIQWRSLSALKGALPDLNLRPFFTLIPELAHFFPETQEGSLTLRISHNEWRQILHLDIEKLFAFHERPARPSSTDNEKPSRPPPAGEETSNPPSASAPDETLRYERTLSELAQQLQLDPRLFFLRLYPEALDLFSLTDPRTRAKIIPTAEDRVKLQSSLPPEDFRFSRVLQFIQGTRESRSSAGPTQTAPSPGRSPKSSEGAASKREKIPFRSSLDSLLSQAFLITEERKRELIPFIQEGRRAEDLLKAGRGFSEEEKSELSRQVEEGRIASETLATESGIPEKRRRKLTQAIRAADRAAELLGTSDSMTPETKAELSRQMEAGGRSETELVRGHLLFLVHVARSFHVPQRMLPDLVQEGWKGIRRGAELFDLSRVNNEGEPIKFITYAHWWVEHYMSRYLVDTGRNVRLPAHMSGKLSRLRAVRTDLENQGKEATPERLAELLDTDLDRMRKLIELNHSLLEHSLDAPFGQDPEGGNSRTRLDLIPDSAPRPDEQAIEEVHRQSLRETLEYFFNTLPTENGPILLEEALENGISVLPLNIRRKLQRHLEKQGFAPEPRVESNPASPASNTQSPTTPPPFTPSEPASETVGFPAPPISPPEQLPPRVLPDSTALSHIPKDWSERFYPRRRIEIRETLRPRIAIVGFGAGGLGASHHLRQPQLVTASSSDRFVPEIVAFEGLGRPGGKMAPNNLGAQFVDWAHFEPVTSMIHRLNLKTHQVPDYDQADFVTHDGQILPGQAFVETLQVLRRAAREALRSRPWEELDSLTSVDFIHELFEGARFNRMQREAMVARLGFEEGMFNISALNYAFILSGSYTPMPRLEVDGGFYRLAEAEMGALIASGGQVHLNTKVERIEALERGARLFINQDGAHRQELFDFAVVTLSPEHFSGVQIEGTQIPYQAIANLTPSRITKTNLIIQGAHPGREIAGNRFAKWFSYYPQPAITFFSGWEGGGPLTQAEMVSIAFEKGDPSNLLSVESQSWDGSLLEGRIPHNYTTLPGPEQGLAVARLMRDQFLLGLYDSDPLRFANHTTGGGCYVKNGALAGELAAVSILRYLGFEIKAFEQRNRHLLRDLFGMERL